MLTPLLCSYMLHPCTYTKNNAFILLSPLSHFPVVLGRAEPPSPPPPIISALLKKKADGKPFSCSPQIRDHGIFSPQNYTVTLPQCSPQHGICSPHHNAPLKKKNKRSRNLPPSPQCSPQINMLPSKLHCHSDNGSRNLPLKITLSR